MRRVQHPRAPRPMAGDQAYIVYYFQIFNWTVFVKNTKMQVCWSFTLRKVILISSEALNFIFQKCGEGRAFSFWRNQWRFDSFELAIFTKQEIFWLYRPQDFLEVMMNTRVDKTFRARAEKFRAINAETMKATVSDNQKCTARTRHR